MKESSTLLEPPGLGGLAGDRGKREVAGNLLAFRQHHLINRVEVVAEPLEHTVGEPGLAKPTIDFQQQILGEIDLGEQRGSLHVGLAIDERHELACRRVGILYEQHVTAEPHDLLDLGAEARIVGDVRLRLVGGPDEQVEVGADALRPPDGRTDRIEGKDLAVLPLALPRLWVGQPAVFPAAAMQIRGILRPDEERARLTSRRGQRLHTADRRKRFLGEPAAGTEPVHTKPGLRGIDGDDRRHRRPALGRQHATPAVAGGADER